MHHLHNVLERHATQPVSSCHDKSIRCFAKHQAIFHSLEHVNIDQKVGLWPDVGHLFSWSGCSSDEVHLVPSTAFDSLFKDALPSFFISDVNDQLRSVRLGKVIMKDLDPFDSMPIIGSNEGTTLAVTFQGKPLLAVAPCHT